MPDQGLSDEEFRDGDDAPGAGHPINYDNTTLGQARIMTGDVGVKI